MEVGNTQERGVEEWRRREWRRGGVEERGVEERGVEEWGEGADREEGSSSEPSHTAVHTEK